MNRIIIFDLNTFKFYQTNYFQKIYEIEYTAYLKIAYNTSKYDHH